MHAGNKPKEQEKSSNQAALRGALLAFAKPVPQSQARLEPPSSPNVALTNGKTRAPAYQTAVRSTTSVELPTVTPRSPLVTRVARPLLHKHSKSDTRVPTLQNPGTRTPLPARSTTPSSLAAARASTALALPRLAPGDTVRKSPAPRSFSSPRNLPESNRQDYFIVDSTPPEEDGNITKWLQGLRENSGHSEFAQRRGSNPNIAYGSSDRNQTAIVKAESTWPRRSSVPRVTPVLVAHGEPPTIHSPRPSRAFTAASAIQAIPDPGKLSPLQRGRSPGQPLLRSSLDGSHESSMRHPRKTSPLAFSTTPEDSYFPTDSTYQSRRSYEAFRGDVDAIQESPGRSFSARPAPPAGWRQRMATVASSNPHAEAHSGAGNAEGPLWLASERSMSPSSMSVRMPTNISRGETPASDAVTTITSARRVTPAIPLSSLSSAIKASHLATSRAASPSKPPLPTVTRRHTDKSFLNSLHPFKHHASRSPSPVKGMRQTMRKDPSSDEDEQSGAHRKKKLFRKHPHKHHEGDRKRWRVHVTERERKRYEGVWAANKGIFMDLASDELSPEELADAKTRVSGLVVRDIWSRSRLPANALTEVWDLVDHDQSGCLTRWEFCVGLWLIDQRLKGRKLPPKVSDSVWSSIRGLQGLKLPRYKDK